MVFVIIFMINIVIIIYVMLYISSVLLKYWRYMKRFYFKSNLYGYDRDCDVYIDKFMFIFKVIFFVFDLVVDVIGWGGGGFWISGLWVWFWCGFCGYISSGGGGSDVGCGWCLLNFILCFFK